MNIINAMVRFGVTAEGRIYDYVKKVEVDAVDAYEAVDGYWNLHVVKKLILAGQSIESAFNPRGQSIKAAPGGVQSGPAVSSGVQPPPATTPAASGVQSVPAVSSGVQPPPATTPAASGVQSGTAATSSGVEPPPAPTLSDAELAHTSAQIGAWTEDRARVLNKEGTSEPAKQSPEDQPPADLPAHLKAT